MNYSRWNHLTFCSIVLIHAFKTLHIMLHLQVKINAYLILPPVWLKHLYLYRAQKVETMFSCTLYAQISLERVLDYLFSSKKRLILKSPSLLRVKKLKFTVLFQGSADRHAHSWWRTSTSALTSPPSSEKAANLKLSGTGTDPVSAK